MRQQHTGGHIFGRFFNSKKFGLTIKLTDVPFRSDIEFHVANTITKDLTGCFGIGESIAAGGDAILNSRRAFRKFQKFINDVRIPDAIAGESTNITIHVIDRPIRALQYPQ